MSTAKVRLQIDPDSGLAPYQQLIEQIRDQVAEGTLAAGDRLPTVRTIAAQLGLANNTVAKAVRELELMGVVDTRGRQGTFVSGSGADAQARAATAEFVRRMRELGLGVDQTVAAVRAHFDSQR